jgi:hypothetical protein
MAKCISGLFTIYAVVPMYIYTDYIIITETKIEEITNLEPDRQSLWLSS